jgi:hypothetical protein
MRGASDKAVLKYVLAAEMGLELGQSNAAYLLERGAGAGIFPLFSLLLAAYGVYSLCPPSYWLHMEYIPSVLPPIGCIWSIFPLSSLLLTAYGVYSLCPPSYWLHMEYIPSVLPPIGCIWSIS